MCKSKRIINYASLWVILCMSPVVYAEESFQSHKSIYQVAKKFIRDSTVSKDRGMTKVVTGKLDSRLKLKKCGKSLHAFLPKGSRVIGKTTVGVKCTGAKPWSLNVPITISIYKNVLAAKHSLQKGDILTESDIKLIEYDVSTLSYGYFDHVEAGIGMKVKRHILSEKVLTPSMLKKPQVITRGQKISILADSGRMQVRMMGKALNNGAIGDRIKVMNMKSRQKIEGVVTSAAEVKVDI